MFEYEVVVNEFVKEARKQQDTTNVMLALAERLNSEEIRELLKAIASNVKKSSF